jgi:hypothetical protein
MQAGHSGSSNGRVKTVVVRTFALVIMGAAVAHATASQLGTHWNLRNESNQAVVFNCEAQLRDNQPAVRLGDVTIPAQSTVKHTWSDSWSAVLFNDGLGLNAASWICSAKFDGVGEGMQEVGRFDTKWGEELTLAVVKSPTGLKLNKENVPANVARIPGEENF